MRTLYLHIGRGKTGTSSIQRFLAANRERLLAEGCHYVRAGDLAGDRGHKPFAYGFIDEPPSYLREPGGVEQALAEVATEIGASSAPCVLLSSENFTLCNPERLRAFFEAKAPDLGVKVVFFARSQDELVESQYNQLVKTAGMRLSFAEYLDSGPEELDFSELLRPWAKVFGSENIIARVYDASSDQVLDQFLACLPLRSFGPLPGRAPEETVNAQVGYLCAETYRVLNGHELGSRKTAYRAIHELLRANDLPALYFDAAEARAYRERFAATNAAFIRNYLGGSGADLGGRRYPDEERDRIRAAIKRMRLPALQDVPAHILSSSSMTG
jgi:hypothetical protein